MPMNVQVTQVGQFAVVVYRLVVGVTQGFRCLLTVTE